jgi:hypothetical protein
MARPPRPTRSAPNALFYPAARAVIAPGRLTACLFTGPEKIRSGFGNGDAILLDGRHHVFAVADATERFPSASRILLTRLAEHLAPRAPTTAEQWLHAINAAYADQSYNHKTTLSCVAVLARRSRSTLFISHGGDSLILVLHRHTGAILFQSSPDMNFAGRCPRLPRVHELTLETGDYTVIIASDGLGDLAHRRASPAAFIASTLLPLTFDQLPRVVSKLRAQLSARANPDDLALVAFDPDRLNTLRLPPLILGGTTAIQEAAFQNQLRAGSVPDQWLPSQRFPERAVPGKKPYLLDLNLAKLPGKGEAHEPNSHPAD